MVALPLLTAVTLAVDQARNAVTELAVVIAAGVVMARYTAGMAASQTVMPKPRVVSTLAQQIRHVPSTCAAQSLVSAARRPSSARVNASPTVSSQSPVRAAAMFRRESSAIGRLGIWITLAEP